MAKAPMYFKDQKRYHSCERNVIAHWFETSDSLTFYTFS